MIQLDYGDPRPLYEQIKDGLKNLIIRNVLVVDQQLPSIRDLAAKLTLNPNTIQKAYRDLELEGYIYSIRGKGNFVAELSQALRDDQQARIRAQLHEVLTAMQNLGITVQQALTWVKEAYEAEGGATA